MEYVLRHHSGVLGSMEMKADDVRRWSSCHPSLQLQTRVDVQKSSVNSAYDSVQISDF